MILSGRVNYDDAERQRLEIVLLLESLIGGDEYIAPRLLHRLSKSWEITIEQTRSDPTPARLAMKSYRSQ